MDLSDLRREYKGEPLVPEKMPENPIDFFDYWFSQAIKSEITEPNAMTLATATKEGKPSARTVLLKYFDYNGFVFYTNYNSRKAKEIAENPNVALLFFWKELERQVRIEGIAEKVPLKKSLEYFMKRPKKSQIAAWISPQSSEIESKKQLLKKFEEALMLFKNKQVPLPKNWGGYIIKPSRIEFWQGQPSRLHDRVLYVKNIDKWTKKLLAP